MHEFVDVWVSLEHAPVDECMHVICSGTNEAGGWQHSHACRYYVRVRCREKVQVAENMFACSYRMRRVDRWSRDVGQTD